MSTGYIKSEEKELAGGIARGNKKNPSESKQEWFHSHCVATASELRVHPVERASIVSCRLVIIRSRASDNIPTSTSTVL